MALTPEKKAQMEDALESLKALTATIENRKGADPASSYVAKLLAQGPQKIAQKVGEEGVEVAIAAAMSDKDGLLDESADLLFHLMVLLARFDLSLADVCTVLAKREGLSGLAEKAGRPNT